MFHLQHTPNTVQALINTQQSRGAHVYCQLDERSRPIDNKYACMNKHMHRIIMSWQSCVQKTAYKSINISAIAMRFTQSHVII